MADERFNDWSPASVFGATAPEPAATRQTRRPSAREPHNPLDSSSSPLDGGAHSTSSPLPALRRKTSGDTVHRENQAGSPASDGDDLGVTRGPERHHLKIQKPGRQLMEIASVHGHSGQYAIDTSQLAVSMQAEEEHDLAVRVLQKHGRMLLLVKREHKALNEVNALRSMLKQAAVSQLVHCYRRYRSRQAIEVYLSHWCEQEARIQRLLRQAQAMKHTREARVIALKTQWRQDQRRRAYLFIAQQYTVRMRLRHQREEKLRAQLSEAQRRIICWYRSRNLELRCRERAYKTRRSVAAQQIQLVYRKFRHRRTQHLARTHAASKIIAACIQRSSARKKSQRRQLETRCALQIQLFYRQAKQMRVAHKELVLRRRIHRGAQLISAAIHNRDLRYAYQRWVAVSNHLQQRELELHKASARRLQTAILAFVARRKRIQRRESAIRIQRLARGLQARAKCLISHQQQRKLARKKRKLDAAIRIQAHFRGFLARQRFAKLLKQLRDRFLCSNCGVIEPSGVYCKLCGRKRANFDLSRTNKCALLLAVGASASHRKPEYAASGPSGVVVMPLHLAPVRPASPPPFPKLHASKNAKLRMQMTRRPPVSHSIMATSSNQQEATATTLEVSALCSLPMVLSPRHVALGNTTPAKRPRPPVMLSDGNQTEQFAFPSRPQPKAVNQTKLRAQALIHIQTQQQELSQTHSALAQRLHRLQKTNHVISRSRLA